jgi:hypothetical protein
MHDLEGVMEADEARKFARGYQEPRIDSAIEYLTQIAQVLEAFRATMKAGLTLGDSDTIEAGGPSVAVIMAGMALARSAHGLADALMDEIGGIAPDYATQGDPGMNRE